MRIQQLCSPICTFEHLGFQVSVIYMNDLMICVDHFLIM